MDIHKCQREAKKLGYDSSFFDVQFPAGKFTAKWLDAYMGLFTVDAPGMDNGFLTVNQVDEMLPNLECYNLRAEKEDVDFAP